MKKNVPLPRKAMLRRLDNVDAAARAAGFDAMLVHGRANSLYLSGFPCSNSLLIITRDTRVFLTDFRYIEGASETVAHMEVRRGAQRLPADAAVLLKALNPTRVGIEGSLPLAVYETLAKGLGRRRLAVADDVLASVRSVKDPHEIALIEANQRLNERVYARVLAAARTGMTERAIRRMIRMAMDEHDAEEAFDSIVAVGPNSSRPHAVAGLGRVRRGTYLLVDMGVRRDHYHSDMTRTVGWGRLTERHREIYHVVLEAQQRALAAIRAGVAARDVDAAARDHVRDAGYGDAFQHGTGHGVGLEIHEAPTLNPLSTDILREGQVVTVEPGIYVPGFGGVRIEDLVVVTSTGCRNLTRAPKRLREIME